MQNIISITILMSAGSIYYSLYKSGAISLDKLYFLRMKMRRENDDVRGGYLLQNENAHKLTMDVYNLAPHSGRTLEMAYECELSHI